jgi:alpha-glucosidase
MLGEGEGAKNNAHYVQAFRQATKSVNPQAYVLGEHFFEASQWLQGDQEDGAMNYYGFAHPVRALFTNKDISYDPISLTHKNFISWLEEARAKLPWANQLSQLNQLDSHDTARFLTLLNGDENKMKLASTLLATYVGVPCLYYGTEVGLEGGLDPDCRRPFPWDKVESSTWIDFYKSLLAIRKQHKALQKGSIQYLIESEDVIVFARLLGDEKIITLLNLSNQQQKVTLPVWKLGCEVGLVKSLFSQTMTEIKVGELVVTLDAQRPEILVINK